MHTENLTSPVFSKLKNCAFGKISIFENWKIQIRLGVVILVPFNEFNLINYHFCLIVIISFPFQFFSMIYIFTGLPRKDDTLRRFYIFFTRVRFKKQIQLPIF